MDIDHKDKKRNKLFKESYIGPLFMNRSPLAWAQLFMALVAIIMGLVSSYEWVGFINFFLAGFLFQSWFFESYINTYRRLNEGLLIFTKRVIDDMAQMRAIIRRELTE